MQGKRIFLYDKRICFDSAVGPIHSVQLAIPEPTLEYATGTINHCLQCFFFYKWWLHILGSFAGVSSEDNCNTMNVEEFLKCLRSLLTR